MQRADASASEVGEAVLVDGADATPKPGAGRKKKTSDGTPGAAL